MKNNLFFPQVVNKSNRFSAIHFLYFSTSYTYTTITINIIDTK